MPQVLSGGRVRGKLELQQSQLEGCCLSMCLGFGAAVGTDRNGEKSEYMSEVELAIFAH